MGHYITGHCPTHGEIDMDDSLAYCEECCTVVTKAEIAKLRAERDNLRGMFEHVCGVSWAFGYADDIDACNWEDEALRRKLYVAVPADDDERSEYEVEEVYTWAWSDLAARAEGRS